jgi:hypothetical protein
MRAPHGPISSRGAGPARGRCAAALPASRSFGRTAAVFDLITSPTSGQLDRATAIVCARAPPGPS